MKKLLVKFYFLSLANNMKSFDTIDELRLKVQKTRLVVKQYVLDTGHPPVQTQHIGFSSGMIGGDPLIVVVNGKDVQ